MRIIIQLLVIVGAIFSLAISSTFTAGDTFSLKETSINGTNHIQSVLLNQGDSKHIYFSLGCIEDTQVDENQDNQEKDKSGGGKAKGSQFLSLKTSTNIEENIKNNQIRQPNIVGFNFTDLVGIIKITI